MSRFRGDRGTGLAYTAGMRNFRPAWMLRMLAVIASAMAVLLLSSGCAPHRRGQPGPLGGEDPVRPRRPVVRQVPVDRDLPEPTPAPARAAVAPLSGESLQPSAIPLAAARIRELALSFRGVPYRWGGASPQGFDCSGLVQYVYKDVGIELPRTSSTQALEGRAVSLDALEVGDLIFFSLKRGVISHVGIYIGDDTFLHAPKRGKTVCTQSLDDPWWRSRVKRVRRVLDG